MVCCTIKATSSSAKEALQKATAVTDRSAPDHLEPRELGVGDLETTAHDGLALSYAVIWARLTAAMSSRRSHARCQATVYSSAWCSDQRGLQPSSVRARVVSSVRNPAS